MCGIVGAYRPHGLTQTTPVLVEKMRDYMEHRGPDGAGLWVSPSGDCILGHRRLSIIDLSAQADQPMSTPDGRVTIVFNGEIYNHRELRDRLVATGKYQFRSDHSDTEALLYAYIEWGMECVHRLYGMFAFAIYDSRDSANPLVHLVRDRFGVKPLYFTKTSGGEWLFASEIKALLVHPNVPRIMNDTAFWHYLTFIVSPAPMTMFDGIFKLPAGYWATIYSDGRSNAVQYWSNSPQPSDYLTENDLSFDEAKVEFLRLLRLSISRRMVSDVPFGAMLSGGVDSSLNVALMSEMMDRPVRTFTVGYEGFEGFNEFEQARRISKRYQTDHHEVRITTKQALDLIPHLGQIQDEPVADNVNIPLYFLSKLVKDSGTTVVQVGEGADENFLGYWWCQDYADKAAVAGGLQSRKTFSAASIRSLVRQFKNGPTSSVMRLGSDPIEVQNRAGRGQEIFWGGAACWWGGAREALTPSKGAYRKPMQCPIDGLVPQEHLELDSHGVVRAYIDAAGDVWDEPNILRKIPYLEHQIRLPEHLLMRVDKMTMAHSVEARVPFLDHDLVTFARRLPNSYKLENGTGKRIIKSVAEDYMDKDLVYRKKQGFGAPMDKWFTDPQFGQLCLAAWEASPLKSSGLVNSEMVTDLLRRQVDGQSNWGFQLWTIMNAVFWFEEWLI